jgi:hypothetical protein
VPRLLPVLARSSAVRRLMFRTVSQIDIKYPTSSLSEGRAGSVAGGDRLPWVPGDNFAPLASLDWQVHVYGAAAPGIAEVCARRGVALHTFAWTAATAAAGLTRDAVYLVRPDGYVGLADTAASGATLEGYLERRAIQPRRQIG